MNRITVTRSPGRCRFKEPGPCPEPAVYTIEIPDCPFCRHHGVLFCLGHGACLEHGANMRADLYKANLGDGEPDHGQYVTVARISAVYREAS